MKQQAVVWRGDERRQRCVLDEVGFNVESLRGYLKSFFALNFAPPSPPSRAVSFFKKRVALASKKTIKLINSKKKVI